MLQFIVLCHSLLQRCSVLQCVTACCSVSQLVAVLQCIDSCVCQGLNQRPVLCVAMYCSVLQRVAERRQSFVRLCISETHNFLNMTLSNKTKQNKSKQNKTNQNKKQKNLRARFLFGSNFHK